MALTTYTELKAEVVSFSHRTDVSAKMDTFCILAEAVINKDLKSLDMEKRLEVTFDDPFYPIPSDYMELRSFHIVNNERRCPVQYFSPQQLDQTFSLATGTVSGFSIHGGQFELRPGPSVTSTVDGVLSYFARVPSLVTESTNNILTRTPMIYLAAMMSQVALYTQDDDELSKWSSIFDSQIKAANKSAQGGRYILPQVKVA